jgi:hypothetical protein
MIGSNLGWDTGFPGRVFWSSSVSSGKFGIVPGFGNDGFLPISFQLAIHYFPIRRSIV